MKLAMRVAVFTKHSEKRPRHGRLTQPAARRSKNRPKDARAADDEC